MSMNIHHKYLTSQIEITNLIEEAVVNASARRKQVLEQNSLSELSEEEQKNITGSGVATDVRDAIILLGGYLLG
ncbi:MAG: hypothetical protein RMY64_24070 [Nostoc sp. DedQUE08]|uniref:hypothetical protein n=1 Tax=unclassified Nostoc TaxID=2593658 RepID=UPI002AD3F2B7|nr:MULTISPECIES: hypothetical protein [unclassified Nostoc]MDZ8032644.1 hypothetical protein [Nostoc sp. DedSLP04]MDZ8068671.1 hypothetical protein [Nostoc sp. DedQUE08]MDZ8131580.1 hypothetical protein [Nostoc sp. DedQUE07]